MGKVEIKSKKKARRGDIQKIILHTIAATGVLAVTLVAPQVIGAMGKLGLLPNLRQGEIIKSSASKLVKRGLLVYKDGRYQLTHEGERTLRLWEIADYKLNKPKHWDKKWRVVIFDIPEKKKKVRDQVRNLFVSAGFERLQDSVWVYPYDCENIIGLLKTDLGIGRDVLCMIVDEIENDRYLREIFKLA